MHDLGWEVVQCEQPFEHEWWAAEFWLIQSGWSPLGARVYITFLVDPMGGGNDIWAIRASKERPPQSDFDNGLLMFLGHGWQKELSGFMKSLDQFRTEGIEK
jgi:hypothetical protein